MLFVETRTADLHVEKRLRTPLLEALRARGLAPLIRGARLHLFEQAAAGEGGALELERALEERAAAEGEEPYVRGDVFCFEDFAHFLIFGEGASLRAGVVYDAETQDPRGKLEDFCRKVLGAFEEVARAARGAGAQATAAAAGAEGSVVAEAGTLRAESGADSRPVWRTREGRAAEVSDDSGEAETAQAQRAPLTPERSRAAEIFEDAAARGFLQRLSEAQADGRLAEVVAGGRGPEQEALVTRLLGAGLVRREVQVSCRKQGRSIFRLPSAEALAIVTGSNAVCSECGSAVADERAEELVTPTPLAASMLKDGAWLASSLRSILAGLGVPEGEAKARPSTNEAEAQLIVNVCGEPFLFVARDGDFTAAHARRAVESETEAQASRLVVVAAGKVQDEARARLREHARRRSRAGSESEVVFVEGFEAAAGELRPVVERVSQEALTRELYELEASAGFNVGYALAARFRLAQQRDGALTDLATSAAGALAGSLREF